MNKMTLIAMTLAPALINLSHGAEPAKPQDCNCPTLTMQQLYDVCWGQYSDKRSSGLTVSGTGTISQFKKVSCTGLGIGKKLDLKSNPTAAAKTYTGVFNLGQKSCTYAYHIGGKLRIQGKAVLMVSDGAHKCKATSKIR